LTTRNTLNGKGMVAQRMQYLPLDECKRALARREVAIQGL
jgi:hypothetical protein